MLRNKMISLVMVGCLIAPPAHAGGWETFRKYGKYALVTALTSLAIYGLAVPSDLGSDSELIISPPMGVNKPWLDQPSHGGGERNDHETPDAALELASPGDAQATPLDKLIAKIWKPGPSQSAALRPVLPLNLKLDHDEDTNGGVFFATAVFRPQAATRLEGLEGTYIGIGSFPPLFHACLGNFSRVFTVDLDEMVYDFSHAHLDLILALGNHYQVTSHQRYQYLAIMQNRWLDPEDLEALEAKGEGRSVNFSHLQEKINKASYLSARGLSSERPLERAIVELNKVKDRHFRHLARAAKGKNPQEIKWFDKEFEHGLEALFKQDGFEKVLFSASNHLWVKLLTMAREKRIQPVLGDLTGSKNMAIYNLSQELKAQHTEPVSAVYLSNVIDMLGSTLEHPVSREHFITNLEAFPYSKDATMIAICRPGISDDAIYQEVRERGYDVWETFDFNADEFISFLKKPHWVFKTYYSSKYTKEKKRACWVEEVNNGVGPRKAVRDCGNAVWGIPSGVSYNEFINQKEDAMAAESPGGTH